MYYAQINLATRIVEAETMPHSPIDAPHMIEISAEQYGTLLGKRHDEQAGAFVDVPVVVPATRILTHLQFRRRFTAAEQELADELEVTFESNPAFTAAQKRTLRTGYKNFYAASEVDLDDPAIPPMLGMYVVVGVLEANRPAEILA